MGEILILAFVSVVGKLIEDARKIELLRDRGRRLKNVHGLYEAFNVHLAISLAVFAYLLSNNVHSYYIICLFLLVLIGVGLKGVFSHHEPERLEWGDSDAKWGMIIPNGCAIAAILLGLWATSSIPWAKIEKKNHSPTPVITTTEGATNKTTQ